MRRRNGDWPIVIAAIIESLRGEAKSKRAAPGGVRPS
jgi:hypothetical protein